MSREIRLAPQLSTESFPGIAFTLVNASNSLRTLSALPPVSAKRIVDVVLAAILLPLTAPLVAAMMVAVAMIDGGRPLYGHERVGRAGRSFRCWKIRTMHLDAAERLERLLADDPGCRRQWTAARKLTPDPRATRLGRFLRRTCIDELPQLWNVLVGDMSLVGPRPVTREELGRYGASIGHYCSIRPGLTGQWQVERRLDTTYEERVAIDRAYVETRTLGRDAAILLRTLRAPFVPSGC
jgi:exopolysaccharide production protein ExoY